MNNLEKKKKILWVDDNPEIILSISNMVSQEIEVSIEFASDVSIALKKIESDYYNVIIIDIFLPIGLLQTDDVIIHEICNRYPERGGIALLNILSLSVYSKEKLFDKIIVTSGYLIESLLIDYKELAQPDLILLHKTDLYQNPIILINILKEILVLNINPTQTIQLDEYHYDSDLNKKIAHFPSQFSKMLHDHNVILMSMQSSLTRSLHFLGANPFWGKYNLTLETVHAEFLHSVESLLKSLDNTLIMTSERYNQTSASSLLEVIEMCKNNLNSFLTKDYSVDIPHLNEISEEVEKIATALKELKILPRQSLKELILKTKNVQRLVCVYDLHHSNVRFTEMIYESNTLKDYIARSLRSEEIIQHFSAKTIVSEAINDLRGYADMRGIAIRIFYPQNDKHIKGIKHDLKRAIGNIIHNAIKYNYLTTNDTQPWVSVKIYYTQGCANVSVENWGVPIKKEEVEQGLILQEGYSGVFPIKKGLAGNGFGLSNTLSTINHLNGKIKIKSVPSRNNNPTDYSQPFITTVTLEIPIED